MGFNTKAGTGDLTATGETIREVIHSCVDALLTQFTGNASGVSGQMVVPCGDPLCTTEHRVWVAIADITGQKPCKACNNTGWERSGVGSTNGGGNVQH